MSSSVLTDHYINRVNTFRDTQATFRERIVALRQERTVALGQHRNPVSIAILGGGPAGLMRAINALVSGNRPTIFEKRENNANGRENVVHLKIESLALLKYYGIYQYLLENHLIFAEDPDSFSVRIKDLEAAMKVVISELTQDPVIQYNSQLERIVERPNDKADLIVRQGGQTLTICPDVIIVVEGKNSSTNENLLHNRRVAVLPALPVIAAIFKDNRPKVTGVLTLCEYVGRTLWNTVVSVYYYALFFFKCCFQGEHIFNSNRRIAGALILQTPNQNYLGCGLSKEETKEMLRLSQNLTHAKSEVQAARNRRASPKEIADLEQKETKAKAEWQAYIKYWTAMAFCFSNILSLILRIAGQTGIRRGSSGIASWQPLDNFFVAELGADKSERYSGTIGRTSYLIAGDTLATVDATTGLGCNTAIQTVVDFYQYILGLNSGENVATLQQTYNNSCDNVISHIHTQSRMYRRAYRPDALQPVQAG
jgi:hypothetical protein